MSSQIDTIVQRIEENSAKYAELKVEEDTKFDSAVDIIKGRIAELKAENEKLRAEVISLKERKDYYKDMAESLRSDLDNRC